MLAGQEPYEQLQMSTVAHGDLDPLKRPDKRARSSRENVCVLLPDGKFLQHESTDRMAAFS